MSVEALLAEVKVRGFRIDLERGRAVLRPSIGVPADLLLRLRQRKVEITAHLRGRPVRKIAIVMPGAINADLRFSDFEVRHDVPQDFDLRATEIVVVAASGRSGAQAARGMCAAVIGAARRLGAAQNVWAWIPNDPFYIRRPASGED